MRLHAAWFQIRIARYPAGRCKCEAESAVSLNELTAHHIHLHSMFGSMGFHNGTTA